MKASEHYALRAEEARVIGEDFKDVSVKLIMDRIMRDYLWLAKCSKIQEGFEEKKTDGDGRSPRS